MTFEEVKKWLEENKTDEAVVSYLLGNSQDWIKSDDGKAFLDTSDGRSLYQAEVDRRVTGALDTYKEKTLPGIVKEKTDEMMAKLNPQETEDQKRIRTLEEGQAESDKKLKKERLSNLALQTLTHKKLNDLDSLIPHLLGEDETTTLSNIDKLESALDVIVQAAIKEALPGYEVTDTDEELDANTKNPWKKGDDYNLTEQGRIFKEKPELAKKLMRLAQ